MKVTLCCYCGSADHLWDICEETRNTPWCEKCGKRGHDISMCTTFLNTCKPVWFQVVILPEGMALVKIEHNSGQSNGSRGQTSTNLGANYGQQINISRSISHNISRNAERCKWCNQDIISQTVTLRPNLKINQ